MPELKTYDLSISHVWRKEEHSEYYRLVKVLKDVPNFSWRNYSGPEHDPLGTKTDKELREVLTARSDPSTAL